MSAKIRARRSLAALLAATACQLPAQQAVAAPEPKARPPAARCPAPRAWSARAPAGNAIRNAISLDREGTIFFNGSRIDPDRLRQYVQLIGQMRPTPHALLEADPQTPCGIVARVADMIDEALDCTRLCQYSVVRWPNPRTSSPPAPPPPPRR